MCYSSLLKYRILYVNIPYNIGMLVHHAINGDSSILYKSGDAA
jgi:hypothetical protein